MIFQMKNTLKSNCNHTPKHPLSPAVERKGGNDSETARQLNQTRNCSPCIIIFLKTYEILKNY
jgi:hypothetical protein